MLKQLDFKVKVSISKELQSQILYHHAVYPGKEWSGILLFKETKGSLQERNLELTADKMFLLTLGDGATVEGDNGESYIDAMEAIPDFMDYKVGYLHTHHSMQAFHSGTDNQEIEDQAKTHEYFLSLIVNHQGSYAAKIGFIGETEVPEYLYKTKFGNYKVPILKNVTFFVDCEILLEVDLYTKERFSKIKSESEKVSFIYTGTSKQIRMYDDYPRYRTYYQDFHDEKNKNKGSSRYAFDKKEMFPRKSANLILKELLLDKEVNVRKCRFETNDTLSDILNTYEMLPEEDKMAADSALWMNIEHYVSKGYRLDDTDKNYAIDYANALADCVDKILECDTLVKKINGFTEGLTAAFLEEVENQFSKESDFQQFLAVRNIEWQDAE